MIQDQTKNNDARRAWLGLMAKADAAALIAAAEPFAQDFEWLRKPEIGGVMVRGRMGGTGAPFNLGEMTVTRCSLRLASGHVGHGYVQGRNKDAAQAAALTDALMQGDQSGAVQAAVLEPLARDAAAKRQHRAEKAAGTKVDFFTLVRGED